MKSELKRKRWLLWLVGITIVGITGIFVGWHYLKKDIQSPNSKLEKLIEKQAEKQVEKVVKKASDSLYDLRYAGMDVNLDEGYAVITNLQMTPNEAIVKKLLAEQKLPNNIVQLKADKIILKNIGLKKVEGEMAMHVGNMTVTNPTVTINNKLRPYNDTTTENKSLFSQITGKIFTSVDFDALVDMRVDNMLMKNTTLVYINSNGVKPRTTRLKNLDFIMTNISTDALANKGRKNTQPAVASIAHHRIVTADKLYYVDFRNIRIIPDEKKVYIGSFELIPTLSKTAFSKAVKAGQANYRYHLKSTGISMNNIDLEKLSRKQQFHIPEVEIDYSWAEYYTNYNWPLRTPPNRRDKYPHELLQKLAFDVTINKMRLKNGDNYFRIVTQRGQEAVFSMNNVKSVYTNITNNAAAKKANPYTIIESNFKPMNTGNMHSVYKLNLADKNGSYTLSSTLSPMDGTVFNPLMEPLALVQLKSLNIQKMQMYLQADEYKAKGNIDFYYKDYKIKMLKQSDDSTLKNRSFVSFVSNLVLPNDNPKKNGKFRKGAINIVRDPRESFFGFQWRAMLDGVSSSMTGINEEKDKPKNIVTKMAKLFYGPEKGQEHKSTGGDKKRLKEKEDNGKEKKN